MPIWVILAILAFGIAICVSYFVTIYNGLILLKQNIEKSWSNIDVLLKQRFDEIPNLVACVKGYMQHEKQVLENVTKARSALQASRSLSQLAQANETMHGALMSLFAVAEKYPDLKANENFLALQKRISELEDHIADRREYYNDSVGQFNTRIEQLPDVFIANALAMKSREFFKTDGNERNPVGVEISA